jgi:hypothetical protein
MSPVLPWTTLSYDKENSKMKKMGRENMCIRETPNTKQSHNRFHLFIYFWCFNATFSNISAISWRPVLVVEEAAENQPWAR